MQDGTTADAPCLQLGVGERRETCRHYGECLGRFLRTEDTQRSRLTRAQLTALHLARREQYGDNDPSYDLPARCPAECRSFEEPSRHASLALAIYWAKQPSGRRPDDEETEAK